jgi:hypothetical protein
VVRYGGDGWDCEGAITQDQRPTDPLTRFPQIWDMSSPNLQASRPIHVLNPSRPVARAAWRPGEHPTELAIIPLASSAVSATESDPDIILDGVGLATGGWTNWVDEIELWDVRREYVAKYAFKSGEGVPSGCLNFPLPVQVTHAHEIFQGLCSQRARLFGRLINQVGVLFSMLSSSTGNGLWITFHDVPSVGARMVAWPLRPGEGGTTKSLLMNSMSLAVAACKGRG